MLILARKKDEKITLTIGGHTTIELMVVSVGNSVARIGIEAPHEVHVIRNELIQEKSSCHGRQEPISC